MTVCVPKSYSHLHRTVLNRTSPYYIKDVIQKLKKTVGYDIYIVTMTVTDVIWVRFGSRLKLKMKNAFDFVAVKFGIFFILKSKTVMFGKR